MQPYQSHIQRKVRAAGQRIGVQLPWRPIGLQATSTCDTVVPAYGDTAGRPPVNPDHAPVQLSGAGNVTARISLCGAGRTLIRKMTGTITAPAIRYHI